MTSKTKRQLPAAVRGLPFQVVPACASCGKVRGWEVRWPDGLLGGTTWDQRTDAEAEVRYLTAAYQLGVLAGRAELKAQRKGRR